MKISIDAGHNCYPDTGANGLHFEDNLTKEVTALLIKKFTALGNEVKDCTPYGQRFSCGKQGLNESLSYRVNEANSFGSELHLCIHANCFNSQAYGTETWITGNNAYDYAKKIVDSICRAIGTFNRGVKQGGLYVTSNTSMPCVLIEMLFVDNIVDANKYNAEAIANAIVKAITGQDVTVKKKRYVVTTYLPAAYENYSGVDLSYVLSYFDGIKCYMKSDEKGMWIETQYLEDNQIENLKAKLGSWFYSVKEEC